MLSSGDVRACLRKLESLLRLIKYPGDVDYTGLSRGDPSAFLPIVSFSLTSFSPPLAEQLLSSGLELTGKTDLRFTDKLYKVLRDIFHYKPVLSKEQFLQCGFSQRKISVVCDIINLVLQKHHEIKKDQGKVGRATQSGGRQSREPDKLILHDRGKCPGSHKDGVREAHSTLTAVDTVSSSLSINHTDDYHTFPISSHEETSNSNYNEVQSTSSECGIPKLTQEKNDFMLQLSQVDGRLSAMEGQLTNMLSRIDGISALEKRLEERQKGTQTVEVNGTVSTSSTSQWEEFITIRRTDWENLNSRVLLLETKLELNNAQVNVSQPYPSSVSSQPDALKEHFKDRIESITNMLKTTSNLMKSQLPINS